MQTLRRKAQRMEVLNLLKNNLEITNSINDDYLNHLINTAKASITQSGYTFGDEYTDSEKNLIVMYASHLYRNRLTSSEGHYTTAKNPQGMPDMLRYELNNAILSQKMRAN